MIKTRSPYYKNVPFVSQNTGLTCASYILELFVWSGDKASPPGTAIYTITKENPEGSTGTDKVDIARLIDDYIPNTPRTNTTTALIDGGDNQVWVKHQVKYNTTDPADLTTPQEVVTEFAVKGYGYGMEGENPQVTNTLLQGEEFDVYQDSFYVLPLLLSETPETDPIQVISYPDNNINYSITPGGTTESDEIVSYLFVKVSEAGTDEYIELIRGQGKINILYLREECKHSPIDVHFFNKDGAQQVITFFKQRNDSMSVENESYQSGGGQPILGNHQFVNYNTTAKSDFRLSTGYVEESINETIKQLLLSENVWIYENDIFTPVNVNTKNVDYRTRVSDRVVSYEIGFDYAFTEINSI